MSEFPDTRSQVATGLTAAHEQGLVHRDVKPENILLEEGVERITLTDFGLARAVDDASVTQPGTIAGTPQYMSPEQTRGEPIDQQSDLFSLGCVFYALCTGRPPFRADSSYAVMRKISDESPMPIRELNPEIPEWLCATIGKLMAKKKVDRFKSAHEVHELLETCLGHAQQPTVTKLPEIPRLRPSNNQPHAFRLLTGVLTMAAIVAGILFGMSFWGGGPQDQNSEQEQQSVAAEEYKPTAAAQRLLDDLDKQGNPNGEMRPSIVEMIRERLQAAKENKLGDAGQTANELRGLARRLRSVSQPNQSTYDAAEKLASICWPLLLAGYPEDLNEAMVEVTVPYPAIRVNDRTAEDGRPTEPLGWDVQSAHAIALARAGKTAEAQGENMALRKKIAVNLEKGRLPDLQVEFLGRMRSQRSLLKQVQLQDSLILAIAGRTSESVDAAAAAGQVEVDKTTKDDQVAIQELLLALAEVQAAHDGQVQSKAAGLKDGDYTLQITHTARHPKVRFPTDAIPETDYKKVEQPASVVRFSDNLKSLTLDGFGGVGELESRAGDTLVYTLERGLDARGGPPAQVIVKQTDKGITATLIQFGSGLPIIVSHKGTLEIPADPTSSHSGVPAGSQPGKGSNETIAAAFKRLYRLNITVMQTNNSIVQTIKDEATAEQAAKDVGKLFPLKAEIRYLERALREFGLGPDQQLYDEYKQQSDKLSDAYVKLAVKVKDRPYFETFNTAYIETSRKTTTLKPNPIPEGHAQRGDGPQFVIWLPAGATPEIDLSAENGTLEVLVVDETTGEFRPQRQTIACGGKALLPIPDRNDGSLYWLRAVNEYNAADSNAQQPERSTQPEPLTWKSLLGKEPPEGYSADALKLIESLNRSRGELMFAGKINRDGNASELEAAVSIQGGFKNMIRQDSFPQWQIVIAWPRAEPTNGLVLNVMALPQPDGLKWMLAPQFSMKDGGVIPGRHKMYEGAWDAKTATLTWTSKQMRSPLKKEDAADEPDAPKSTFDMVVKANGEIQLTGYPHNESIRISGQTAARVGEPYVEKEAAIPKLPGGYKVFFASRLEVDLVTGKGEVIAGPRLEKIGCEGDLIFGLISIYDNSPERSDKPGYFWLETTTGEITKGMELAAWREALKSRGISEPRLFAPESVEEQY